MSHEQFTKQELKLIYAIFSKWENSYSPHLVAEDMKHLDETELKKIAEQIRFKTYLRTALKCPRCKWRGIDKIMHAGKKKFCAHCKDRNKLSKFYKQDVCTAIANVSFLKEEHPAAYGKVVRFIIQLARKEQEGKTGIGDMIWGASLYRLKKASREQIIASVKKSYPECFEQPKIEESKE